jgi:TM2 domain-containing membrane protein YozV
MQYEFATQEYERLNFLYPKDSISTIELAKTYRLGSMCNKLEKSHFLLSKEKRIFKNTILTKEYLNFCLICKKTDKNYDKYSSFLTKDNQNFYILSKYWISKDYDKLSIYPLVNKTYANFKAEELRSLTLQFNQQKYKKPLLGLLMSAVLPGSGKAYANRWGDAIVSFIFIGSNAFATYRAYSKKGTKSVNAWIFGGLTLSFYSANLWGSFKAVKNYNNHLTNSYQQNAENIIYSSF